MRKDERHLVEVPRKQLSRLSKLVVELRRNPEAIGEYASFSRLTMAVLDIETNGADSGFEELLSAMADLIMEAVYPA